MKIVYLPIDELKVYGNNPRNNEPAIEVVKKSIEEYGFRNPVLIDKDNVIVAGHTRRLAAMELGLKEVPCIVIDDLTPEQIKAYRLVDNKTSEYAEWDFELLERELEALKEFDMDMTVYGFVDDFEEEIEEMEKEQPEIEFTKCVEENHNYIVLYFDNNIDWLQAQSVFDIKPVKEYSTRKDGVIKKETRGVGRVIDGATALSKMTEGLYGEN